MLNLIGYGMKWLISRLRRLMTFCTKSEEPLSYLVRKEMIIELQERTFRNCSPKAVGEITAWALMLSELADDSLIAVWEIECDA